MQGASFCCVPGMAQFLRVKVPPRVVGEVAEQAKAQKVNVKPKQ